MFGDKLSFLTLIFHHHQIGAGRRIMELGSLSGLSFLKHQKLVKNL
jgi:predicted nicotinamide N-methyase